MNQPLLSILICTLPERKKSFAALYAELLSQDAELCRQNIIKHSTIELISDAKDRGEATIGTKRNWLKESARSKYIMYLDDDDEISKNFLHLIVEGCMTGKDIITYDFNYFVDGKYLRTMMMNRFWGKDRPQGENDHCSKHWATTYNPTHRFTIAESHYHLCAVKKELADQVQFIDANNAEDVEYSKALIPLIQSEYHIEHTLLNVNFSTTKTQNV